MGRGWDMSLGVLKHIGWTALLALRDRIERLPELRKIVRQLGRLEAIAKAVAGGAPHVAELHRFPLRDAARAEMEAGRLGGRIVLVP